MSGKRLAAEALAAVTGLWPGVPPSTVDLLAAEGLGPSWSARIAAWLVAKQAPFVWQAPPEDLYERLVRLPDADETASWLGEIEDTEISVEYANVIVTGRAYLRGLWPVRVLEGPLPDVLPASSDEIAEIWSAVRAVDTVQSYFDDIASWAVTAAQVAAFRTVFPTLAARLDEIVVYELSALYSVGGTLAWQQEEILRTITGKQHLSATPQADQPSAPPSGAWHLDFSSSRTPSERPRR